MDLLQEQTKEQFARFSARFGPAAIVPATVLAVNEDDTIQVQFSDGAIVDDARLKSVVKDGNKCVLTPKMNSTVLVGKIENSDEYVVVAVEEITRLQLNLEALSIDAAAEGITIKKGEDSLKDILQLTLEAVMKIVVLQGNNPDYVKLQQALQKTQNLFR